ncbi:MAG: hypothetical protein WCV90_05630 [Candidatus Woesearchaeota archaeon]|jgi:hypothetical protein
MIVEVGSGRKLSLENLLWMAYVQTKDIGSPERLVTNKINEILTAHQGEPMLIRCKDFLPRIGQIGRGDIADSPTTVEEIYRLGFLTEGNLEVTPEEALLFPTSGYASWKWFKTEISRYEEKLPLPWEEIPFVTNDVFGTLTECYQDERRSFEVRIGVEVLPFVGRSQLKSYLQAAHLLGKIELVDPAAKGEVVKNIYYNKPPQVPDFMLKDALSCGLHLGTWSFSPEPGVNINGPEYLKGMCARYSIPIPE